MKTNRIEVTRKHLKWVTWAVLVATTLFVIASLNPALNRLDQTAFAILNAARYLMLGCFVTLAVGLVWYRESTPERLSIVAAGTEIYCSPCERGNVWIVSAEDLMQCKRKEPITILAGDLRKIQIVVMRSISIPEEIIPSLQQLKHLAILDVQGANVPANFWNELENCRDLEYILACGAIIPGDMKQLHMTLPEAKFFLDRRSLVIGNRATT
ncbi:MAG: hypothetical protein MUC43_03355 [Pirellula sp.]|jgi:hypothetical protein|nr:hypothetical protein [Pirellula sp.]